MFWKEFYKITKELDRNKYHICCEVHQDMIGCDWYIFRKDMSFEDYWSSDNKPILTSKLNTEQELIDFCEKEL